MLLLSQLAGKLGNDSRIHALQDASSAEQIIKIICSDDEELDNSCKSNDEEIVDLDINL